MCAHLCVGKYNISTDIQLRLSESIRDVHVDTDIAMDVHNTKVIA